MAESDKTTGLKKAYAEIILNTAKESAARVLVSDRKSARFHHDLSETKGEALRLLVRLKHMIDAKTIEAEVISSNQQRQIDVLEAQLHEAEDIITDLRSEVSWVRDRLEKAKAFESQEMNLVNEEEQEDTVSVHIHKADPEVVLECLKPDEKDHSSLHDAECENEEKQAYESQEQNCVNIEEEETVSVHKVDPEVVVECLNPNQEDRSSLDDVECENDENLGKTKVSESRERSLVNKEEGMVFDPEAVLECLNPERDDPCECENMEKSELQERDLVNIEEETVSVVESLAPDQEVADTCFFAKTLDVDCENDEKHFDGLSVVNTLYESQERNIVNKEEEEEETVVSVHKVYPEVVTESFNLNQEDHSSLHDVECENLDKQKASESHKEEEEMVSDHKVVPECLKPDQEVADTCKIHDAECENDKKLFDGLSVVDTVMGNDVCEPESDGDIRIKKLELSRNGCTQRIHALERVVLERKSPSSADEEEQQGTTEKDSEESLRSGKADTLGNTRCLVLALRASSAEVVTLPSNALGIKKPSKRRRKRRFGKPKAKSVRTQSHQLIKPCCQSQSNVTCSKTSTSDGEDSIETHLSVESKEVLVDVLVRCEGEEDSVVPSTETASNSDSKSTAVVSDQISESPPRANVNRLLKYTFQRKRKRGSANINEDSNSLPRKHQENEAQDQTESTLK